MIFDIIPTSNGHIAAVDKRRTARNGEYAVSGTGKILQLNVDIVTLWTDGCHPVVSTTEYHEIIPVLPIGTKKGFVFDITTNKTQKKFWKFCYIGITGLNMHSQAYENQQQAYDEIKKLTIIYPEELDELNRSLLQSFADRLKTGGFGNESIQDQLERFIECLSIPKQVDLEMDGENIKVIQSIAVVKEFIW